MEIFINGEVQRFWEAMSAAEVKAWVQSNRPEMVKWRGADGTLHESLARPDLEEQIDALPDPSNRIRILSPFDPLVRDRNRLQKLFGFDYRIEIFALSRNPIFNLLYFIS